MRKILAITIIGALVAGSCTIQRSQTAATAKKSMIGLSKEQVLACMGSPARTTVVGSTEVWRYGSGGSHSTGFGTGSSYSGVGVGLFDSYTYYCIVDVVMADSRVSRINYSGPSGAILVPDEQCAFAVENCVN